MTIWNIVYSRAENWWHISTQKPPNVGSSSAISEPIIAGLVSARDYPTQWSWVINYIDLPRLGRCSAMSGPIGFVKLCLTLFYTLGLLYWVGLGNIQPTQILLYWVKQAEHRLHREVAGMIGLDWNHNYQLIGLNCNCIVMKYGTLSILHTLLALINFCFNQDNHKQKMHDVKFNINQTSCH